MKSLILFLFSLVATINCTPSETVSGYFNSRIVGGREAQENEIPYTVSLSWIWDGETVSSHGCGGSIISESWILTAAHCMNWQGGRYIVRAGALDLNRVMDGEQTSTIRNVFIHPGFDPQAIVSPDDIALIELETPLVFTVSVRPIALPSVGHMPALLDARVSGWGSISNNETVIMPRMLQTILLPVISNEECQQIIDWSGSTIYPQDMCTGNGANGGIGTCGGDSGSGLTQGNAIIGVVQWGFFPCSWSPTVYARVSHFVPWINDVMSGNV